MASRSYRTIYVGNLPLDVKEWEIEDLFYKFEDPSDAEDAIRGRDGYNFDGCRIRVELAHGGRGQSSRREYGGGSRGGRGQFGASRRSEFRVVVHGLPSSASWQDLKDHMRKAGDVCFAEVYPEGAMGIVDYTNYDDMKYAGLCQGEMLREQSSLTGVEAGVEVTAGVQEATEGLYQNQGHLHLPDHPNQGPTNYSLTGMSASGKHLPSDLLTFSIRNLEEGTCECFGAPYSSEDCSVSLWTVV
ncbi:hypothetical protein V6N13_105811 [Hibiscus sabdariffa]|uniref:RRM domain-containing protein n=1 Tax=Hibiscus sabdariffa TaxID=183260 RepID=A0ABR2EYT4_9ROSI